MKPLEVPVLFLVFNRPRTTYAVFEAIRSARPKRLFIAADGPRPGREEDRFGCAQVREIVAKVDWDCEVRRLFRQRNLGLKRSVSSAIDWFFRKVEEGIILEEDCLPSASFFIFCQELLERYRSDERVMQISGSNFLFGERVTRASYFFAKLNDVWGWATWKRAWKHFDVNMKGYPKFKRERRLYEYLGDEEMSRWLESYLDEAYGARKSGGGIWSSAWAYAIASRSGLTAVPSVNLVAPIGELSEGTNTRESFSPYYTVEAYEMDQIIHPEFVRPNRRADELRFALVRRTDPRLASLSEPAEGPGGAHPRLKAGRRAWV